MADDNLKMYTYSLADDNINMDAMYLNIISKIFLKLMFPQHKIERTIKGNIYFKKNVFYWFYELNYNIL